MWDDDQTGTTEDNATQEALVKELKDRCFKLLKLHGKSIPVNWGSGSMITCRLGDVDIKFEQLRGLWVDLFIPGESSINGDRAFTQNDGSGGYLNRHRVRDIVLPYLRRVMILDDIVDAVGGSSSGRQVADGEG